MSKLNENYKKKKLSKSKWATACSLEEKPTFSHAGCSIIVYKVSADACWGRIPVDDPIYIYPCSHIYSLSFQTLRARTSVDKFNFSGRPPEIWMSYLLLCHRYHRANQPSVLTMKFQTSVKIFNLGIVILWLSNTHDWLNNINQTFE